MGWVPAIQVVLAAVALFGLLWGARQAVLIQRLRAGLIALRRGDHSVRLCQRPDDREPVLADFDALARELQASSPRGDGEGTVAPRRGPVLHEKFVTWLGPPLLAADTLAHSIHRIQATGSVDRELRWQTMAELHQDWRDTTARLARILQSRSDSELTETNLHSGERSNRSSRRPRWLILVAEPEIWLAPMLDAGWIPLIPASLDQPERLACALEVDGIVLNLLDAGGLGWELVAALGRRRDGRVPPIAVTAMDRARGLGGCWLPRRILSWPDSPSQIQGAFDLLIQSMPQPCRLVGNSRMVSQLSQLLASRDVPFQSQPGTPLGILGLSSAAVVPADRDLITWPETGLSDSIWLVPGQVGQDAQAELSIAVATLPTGELRSIEELIARWKSEYGQPDAGLAVSADQPQATQALPP